MALNKSLVSKFVKTTSNNTKNNKKETFLHGYIVIDDSGKTCVKVSNYSKDGLSSDSYIPVKITTNVNVDQPVTVMIKNHTATVIGNAAEVHEENTSTRRKVLNNTTSTISSIESKTIQDLWADYFNEN